MIYFASSAMACLFPVFWLIDMVIFESKQDKMVPGWMTLLIFGSIVMFCGFMGRLIYHIWSSGLSPNLFLLMNMVHDLKGGDKLDDSDRKRIEDMYSNGRIIAVVMENIPSEIASVVLEFALCIREQQRK